MDNKLPEVSKHIKDKFDVVGVVPGKVKFGNKVYDLTTIDAKTAAELVEKKFPYLKPKPAQTKGESK